MTNKNTPNIINAVRSSQFSALLLILFCFSCSNINHKETTFISLDAGPIFDYARNISNTPENTFSIVATLKSAKNIIETQTLQSESPEDINGKEVKFEKVPLGEKISIYIDVYNNEELLFIGSATDIIVDTDGKTIEIKLHEYVEPESKNKVLKVQKFELQQMNNTIKVSWSYKNNPTIQSVELTYNKNTDSPTTQTIEPSLTEFFIELDGDTQEDDTFTVTIQYKHSEDNFSSPVTKTITLQTINQDYSDWHVGDVVTTTERINYNSETTFTDEQKASAVAVVVGFIEGIPIGVGLKQPSSKLKWAPTNTNGNTTNFTGTTTTYEGSKYDTIFTSGLHGKDNWESIKRTDADGTKEENIATYYPAFNYALNYGNTDLLKDTSYADGWYIPSLAELYEIYKNKTVINQVLQNIGGTKIASSHYWTSSQHQTNNNYAHTVTFQYTIEAGSGYTDISYLYKSNNNYVLVIRSFGEEE